MILRKTINKFQIDEKLPESFEDTSRLRQVDSLSTTNFNLTLDIIIHNTTVNPRGTIFNRCKQYMAYADDAVITERSRLVINKVIQEMDELSNGTGLQAHVDKTEYMNTSKYKHKNLQPKTKNITYKGYQERSEFKYLGSLGYL